MKIEQLEALERARRAAYKRWGQTPGGSSECQDAEMAFRDLCDTQYISLRNHAPQLLAVARALEVLQIAAESLIEQFGDGEPAALGIGRDVRRIQDAVRDSAVALRALEEVE